MNADEQDQIDQVHAVAIALDVDAFCQLTGCPRRSALASLHKARYELEKAAPELRHASRLWLEENGYSRLRGVPWPDQGVLP